MKKHIKVERDSDNMLSEIRAALNDMIEVFQDGSGNDVTPVRTATLVVAANTSSAKSKAQADYVCDGVADNVEIQAAIDAAALIVAVHQADFADSGGATVQLLEGNFWISSTIIGRHGVSLIGQPGGLYNTTILLADNSDCNMFEWQPAVSGGFFGLENLYFNGRKAQQGAGTFNGIVTDNSNSGNPMDIFINHVFVANCAGTGFNLLNTWGFRVNNCLSEFNDETGFYFSGYESYAHYNYSSQNGGTGYMVAFGWHVVSCESSSNGKHGYRVDVDGLVHLVGCKSRQDGTSGTAYFSFYLAVTCQNTKLIGCYQEDDDSHIDKAYYIDGDRNTVLGCTAKNSRSTYIISIPGDYNIVSQNHILTGKVILSDGSGNIYARQHSDHFQDCIALSTTYIHAAITGTGAEQEITTAITNPDVPRNISITNSANSTGDVTIEGIDTKGNSVTDVITIVTGGTAYGVKAFATVSKITIPATVVSPDTIAVGISDKLGLMNVIYVSADVYKVKKNNADTTIGTVDVTNGTVNCATITGADDFTIYYRSNLNIIS